MHLFSLHCTFTWVNCRLWWTAVWANCTTKKMAALQPRKNQNSMVNSVPRYTHRYLSSEMAAKPTTTASPAAFSHLNAALWLALCSLDNSGPGLFAGDFWINTIPVPAAIKLGTTYNCSWSHRGEKLPTMTKSKDEMSSVRRCFVVRSSKIPLNAANPAMTKREERPVPETSIMWGILRMWRQWKKRPPKHMHPYHSIAQDQAKRPWRARAPSRSARISMGVPVSKLVRKPEDISMAHTGQNKVTEPCPGICKKQSIPL